MTHIISTCLAGAACILLLAGCGKAGTQQSEASQTPVVRKTSAPPIAPSDFVFAPCERATVKSDCVVIAAGGKRLLIGAPAGVGAGQIAGDKTMPDAVVLFSLHAEAIEGLDEVRNAAWVAERSDPLMVAGGDGVERFVASLNDAYVTSDALSYIAGERRHGFDKAAIAAKRLEAGDIAFDTGDLTVMALSGGAAQLAFLVTYNGQRVILSACGAREQDIANWPEVEAYIGCDQAGVGTPKNDVWPLIERVYPGQ